MKSNAKLSVRPGDTFIAYINDSTSIVGVAVKDEGDEDVEVLVLGYFESDGMRKQGVFDSLGYPFPTYKIINKRNTVPYAFKQEIALCKARDSEWWKSLNPSCYINLVARHFRPRHLEELQYIDAALHVLNKGTIDGFKSFGYLGDEIFLRIWAVLHVKFPERTIKPPEEWDSRNSNVFYRIEIRDGVDPKVTSGLRPSGYEKTRR